MNLNSAFTGSFAENPFRYQQFNLRDIRILRGAQPIVHHDTTDNCRLYVTTMKAMNFQDEIPSIPVDNFKDHYVLDFDLTSMKDATEHCHYPEIFREPLRLQPYFSSPLENVTEVIVLGRLMSSVAVDRWETLPLNKLLTVYLCSSIGTWDRFPQTLFQTFQRHVCDYQHTA